MPPKKTLKALAAEEKKRNADQAKKIVAMLARNEDKADGSVSDSSDDVGKRPRKRIVKVAAAELKRKNACKAKEIVAKVKRTADLKVQDVVPIPITTEMAKQSTSNSSEADKGSVDGAQSGFTEHVTMCTTSRARIPVVSSNRKTSSSSTSSVKTASGDAYQYEYAIDCTKVADSIAVVDLKRHLEMHLKVNGAKGNLGSTVSISCQGQQVVIKSKTFLPKKSLRFLSKKFLKKNWNIRVLSKNPHSYEYKYVGTP